MALFSRARSGGPVQLSIYDPIHVGVDPFGQAVTLNLAWRNCLVGGEPGAGKSVVLTNVIGHAALSLDVDLVLIDGKDIELPLWSPLAVEQVGRDMDAAIDLLARLDTDMAEVYAQLKLAELRKLPRSWRRQRLIVIDELAMFLVVFGTPAQRKEFLRLLLGLVSMGRAAGLMVLAAAQRPSANVVPTELRDLMSYRCALRCTTDASSDIVLGEGWATLGYSAAEFDPAVQGVGYLLADGGMPRKFRGPYLTDDDIRHLVAAGLALRGRDGQAAA